MTSRAFLPSWQDMELASPSNEEPVTQIEADVPPVQADAMDLELELHACERPLAVSHFGTPEMVPEWQDTHAMKASVLQRSQLGRWIRTDLGVRTFQGLGKNSPAREQVVRRITRDLHTNRLIESLPCESHSRCHCTVGVSLTAVIQLLSHVTLRLPSFGGGLHLLFKNWHVCSQHVGHSDFVVHAPVH